MSDGPTRRVVEALDRRGLAGAARLLADAHRPMAPLLGDLGVAVGPLLGLVGGPLAADARSLVEDPDALDRLVSEIDACAEGGRRADPG